MGLPLGWFNDKDIAEYRRIIGTLPDGARMVEVGVWLGRSLCSVADLIVQKGIHVIAVDSYVKRTATHYLSPRQSPQETFLRNMHRVGLTPECLWMSTFDAAKVVDPVDFVFLDDDHREAHLRREIRAWLPKTRLVLGGHDYHAYPAQDVDVKRTIDVLFPHATVSGRVWSVEVAHV